MAEAVAAGSPRSPSSHAATYRRLVGARVRSQWQYRTSFVLHVAGQFVAGFFDFVAIAVIFDRVHALDGWQVEEVLFLYGTSQLAFGIGDVFVSPVERAADHVRLGTFDQLLVRPLGPLFQLVTGEFELRRVGRLVQGLVVFVAAVVALPVEWTAGRVVMTAATVAGGVVIFSSAWVLTSSIAFWAVATQELANSVTYGGGFLTQYPVDIFGAAIRRLLLVVPMAFVSYVPATWVLGRDDVYGLPSWCAFASPAVALAFALVARFVWRSGIRHYRSTGS
ncbi:MAG TPA: ABC-2 family transporter protein [Acidimicrobiales bacterium]|nr:ABC-2 family transporter protein [Acidimicrobiales bacterium]